MAGFIKDIVTSPFRTAADLVGLGSDSRGADRGVPELDATTQELIKRQSERANVSDAQLEAQDMAGMDQSGAAGQATQDVGGFSGSLGGDTATLSKALSNRANKIYDRELADAKRTYKSNMPLRRAELAERARAGSMMQHSIASENYARIQQQQADRAAARGQAIGQILGIAGMVGGAMIGGPAGAAAGGQMGQSMGGGQQPAPQQPAPTSTTYESKNFGTIGGGR